MNTNRQKSNSDDKEVRTGPEQSLQPLDNVFSSAPHSGPLLDM